jgi:autophagy-related protein 16
MVHLWTISSTGQQNKYCSLQGSHGAINALDFDNEGCGLLAGCSSDKAYIWSYGEHKILKDTFTGHQGLIFTCKFISGTKLATGSADRTIKIWDLYSRQCTRTLLAPSKCHDLVVIDAAGTIISGHFDRKIRIWDPFTDKCRTELKYDSAITSLSYNNEKQQLLACFKDDTLKLIDLRQNKTIHTFSHDNFKISNDTTKAILSPDGRYACVGSHDGSLFVWNTETGLCENVLERKHTTMVTSVAWQPDGKYVASCEKQRRVILWSH